MGVAEEVDGCCAVCDRGFVMLKGVVSSLLEDSSLLGLGRARSTVEALLPGKGEKLPGALCWDRAGCMVADLWALLGTRNL